LDTGDVNFRRIGGSLKAVAAPREIQDVAGACLQCPSCANRSRSVFKDEILVSAKTVKVVLNQQQLELLDNTVARGIAPDRESLIRTALKEFAAKHSPAAGSSSNKQTVR
jgi:bacterioferritin-associated ferredoxin